MKTVITTVGTSVLSNYRKANSLHPGGPLPELDVLARYLKQTPVTEASAETNSLSRLLDKSATIDLLHSCTPEGKLCAAALHLNYADYSVTMCEIYGIVSSAEEFKTRGLKSLVSLIIERIMEAKKVQRQPIICATGGFKAETAYATMVGQLFDVPVYYIHEQFSEIIEMPTSPIGWDYHLLAEHEEFCEWLFGADSREARETENRLKGMPAKMATLVLQQEDGNYTVSPIGYAIFERYQDILETGSASIKLSPSAHKDYLALDSNTRGRFDSVFKKLRVPSLWMTAARQEPPSDCLIYPGGHRDERVFFEAARDSGELRVLEIARHSDKSYERKLDRRVKSADYVDQSFVAID